MRTIYSFLDYQCFLKSPYDLLLIIHGTVFFGLVIFSIFNTKTPYSIYKKLNFADLNANDPYQNRFKIGLLFLLFILCVSLYLYHEPFENTGLYHMIIGSPSQAEAREASLKLLNNNIVKYIYTIVKSALAPVLFIILVDQLFENKKNFLGIGIISISIVFVVFLSNLNGEKSFLLLYAAYFFTYLAFHKKLGLRYVVIGALLILASIFLPVIMISGPQVLTVLVPSLFSRLFIIPLKVGTWYIHDAQIYGYEVKRLLPESLYPYLSLSNIDYNNFIGKKYAWFYAGRKTHESISANASFIFIFYKGFGLLSVLFSLVLLYILDYITFLYRFMDKKYIVLFLVFLTVKTTSFVSSGFYTSLMSHGILIGFSLFLFLSLDFKWLISLYNRCLKRKAYL